MLWGSTGNGDRPEKRFKKIQKSEFAPFVFALLAALYK
jgi:hypothetical protein